MDIFIWSALRGLIISCDDSLAGGERARILLLARFVARDSSIVLVLEWANNMILDIETLELFLGVYF